MNALVCKVCGLRCVVDDRVEGYHIMPSHISSANLLSASILSQLYLLQLNQA